MKCFLEPSRKRVGVWRHWIPLAIFFAAIASTLAAMAELPAWIRNIESGSPLEAVFFRRMTVAHGAVGFRRPPRETRPELGNLIKSQPGNAELYSLRALEDEQQLDFAAAEADWKSYAAHSSDKLNAEFALGDFYHRRLRPGDEINALMVIANSGPIPAEKLTAVDQQRSWLAFERIFGIIQEQGLAKETSIAQYRAWIARYPQETSLYSRFLQFLVGEKEFTVAGQVIASYQKQFPADQIFPVKAKAMLEYRRTSVRDGLSVYERSFEPLWDPELVKSYFDLLRETDNLRNFLDQARTAIAANPEDLNATARVFYYYQQEGRLQAAAQAITEFRRHKEAARSPWTSRELYVCARLLEEIHFYPESARYYFALYNSQGLPDAQEQAIAELTDILLTAPEMPIRFGSGELSMYRDIGTMDQGPGYLNGILSLILNTTEPAAVYFEEEQKAVPYFHRSRAAELLAMLDSKFPNSTHRPELHAKLLEFYAAAGESEAVVQGGREFLANFKTSPQRTQVALLMADAYARRDDTTSEFAIYDSVLRELAAGAQNVPLGKATVDSASGYQNYARYGNPGVNQNEEENSEAEGEEPHEGVQSPSHQAFQIGSTHPVSGVGGARSPEYARVLERYLARLAQRKQIPRALSVLSGEIERNPDDPGLYERLAVFLEQNRLGTEQEEVYRRAMARFPDRSWWDKLARFYIRNRRESEFEQLTREAVKSFSGTDLERYFRNVDGSPALYLRLNQYANQRFPHNPLFVRNLLQAYRMKETYNEAAWEELLRQHWFEESDLRNEFFEYLSRTGQLESELEQLQQVAPDAASWEKNPAAADFLANANLWRSHFEESAPELKSLAAQYPAEPGIAHTASAVYRSLAYFDPSATAIAAKIEDNLSQFNPGNTETLARIGDIHADREQFAQAAPYWERIARVAPGQPGGYLEAATIYWDYFDFANALRLLNQGRTYLKNPNLYSYEAGAIYENQRDYARAVDEYVKGALANPGSSSELRLLQLARRPKLRGLVDQATAKSAPLPDPMMPAVNLRVKVLDAQNRKSEMESFLDAVIGNATSLEKAEAIGNLAQEKSLETVRQHALEKQIALTTDPVNRMQLRYALVRLYESHKDFLSAESNIEALYKENPKILGVVRSTVDFYWNARRYPPAITVLLQAAKDANPDLKKQFTYEAARKATEAKDYQQARELLTKLLDGDPYNSEYLAAMADAYSRAGDDAGLQQFYRDKIALFRDSSLPPEARRIQIASLRRSLIPALTRHQNYAGGVDQYIELINSFPEDDALVSEAALYAQQHQRQSQLISFYLKTVAQSPRDYRWSMVLARIYTSLEDYPSAIDRYANALKIRPDRSDLLVARAGLEERLMRFDAAAGDYQNIYLLNYKDPQWMEKLAEIRARQGRTTDAVAGLKAALIEGRPENAANYFEAARRLEGWGMLNQARDFAQQGTKMAGPDLLAESQYLSGAKTYVQIMTRLRKHDEAYNRMETALSDAASAVNILEQQVARQGIASITNESWRDRVRQNRIEAARNGMASVLEEMGGTVNAYFTPEERLNFSAFVEAKRKPMSISDVEKFAIPLAQSAALADQEARWRFEVMLSNSRARTNYYVQMQPLIDLQRHRGRLVELAGELEQYAATLPAYPSGMKMPALLAAADAYRSAGDQANELRVLNEVSGGTGAMDNSHQQRFFELALARKPDELLRVAAQWTFPGQRAADYAVAHGSPELAHAVVEARSRIRPRAWNRAYNALVGLYFSENTPQANDAFRGALGNRTIGERLTTKIDRGEELAGGVWYYYASRYGEYLGATRHGNAEDYLRAMLEESPATASHYLTLADYYAGAGDTTAAIRDYEHALELAPARADVYDDLAVAYFKQGDRNAALTQWKRALTELSKQLEGARVPETFWSDFGRTCDQLRARHLFADLKPDMDALLRAYLHRNGSWRSNALLKPAYLAVNNPASATAWMLEISSSAADPAQILADVVDATWMPPQQREAVYQRILQLKQDAVGKPAGAERDAAPQDLAQWQVRWIKYLVSTKKYSQAADALTALPKETRDSQVASLVVLELRVAAQLGTLDSKLESYRQAPQDAPVSELLRRAAHQLLEAGDPQSARKILEFVFAREIDNHQLIASNFLGLAEVRLASGDTRGALDLLHRLVVVVGNPFENLDPAAALLEKTGHSAEAIEFLEQLVKSAPWNASYSLRLAKAQLAAGQDQAPAQNALISIASSQANSYELRSQAATALAGRAHADLGSGELNLLAQAGSTITPAAADKFYYYEARIRAAQVSNDASAKMQLLSHCITDFPRRDEARVPLFLAAVSAQSDEFALAAIEPVMNARFLVSNARSVAAQESPETSEEEDGSNIPESFAPRLSRAERAQVAREMGESLVRLNRPADALGYFEAARRSETAAPTRRALERTIAQVRAEIRIQAQNAARQPILHEALDQDRIVRPKLAARLTPARQSANVKGGAQP
ncbi:MAG TPA: hypothetical protein VF133_12915 [Terriglobales bacterium]